MIMKARRLVKVSKRHARIVGVIASGTDLRRALQMADPPDFFEIRLDHLTKNLDELEKKMSIHRRPGQAFPVPLIFTARHPAEGGVKQLSTRQRRELLVRFLPYAGYVDVELRSARALRSILDAAHAKKIGRIISFHDFKDTPRLSTLKNKARAAKSLGADIFKVATRTDTPAQLERLFDFVASKDVDLAVSAMGMGRLGAISRVILAQLGSVFIYCSLSQPNVEGQLSIRQLRSAISALKIG
jgi:3-dehydroquinate dehydratase-1